MSLSKGEFVEWSKDPFVISKERSDWEILVPTEGRDLTPSPVFPEKSLDWFHIQVYFPLKFQMDIGENIVTPFWLIN